MQLRENKGISKIGVIIIILVVLLIVAILIKVCLFKNPVSEENTGGNVTSTPIYSYGMEETIKETIENYYKLVTAKEKSAIFMLTDVMELTVYGVQDPTYSAPADYVEHPDPYKYQWTGIKYKDFKNSLWYISESLLQSNFPEFVEYKDYLYVNDPNQYDFKDDFEYKIVKQEISDQSTQDTCICFVTVENSKTGDSFTDRIKMARGNGDFVIVAVDKV